MRALRIINVSPAPLLRRNSDAAVCTAEGRSRALDPPLGLRLRTFVDQRALDRRLAAGSGVTSPPLALRASQLTDPRARRELAESIRGVLRCGEGGRPQISEVGPDQTAVKYARAALSDLADHLELAHHVTPRGVLLARRLMTDHLSPIYNPNAERTVTEVAREIQSLLLVPQRATGRAA